MKQIHCLAIGLLFMLGIGLIIGCDDYHEVVTEDGVTLKMKRYRPAVDAPFRENQQPILLLPGNMSNMNEFLVHTSEEKKKDYAAMELPADAAEWAIGEPYIEEDPMKYYSLAHYLWVKGYDVWLGNYRGTGRKEYKSENGSNITNIDIWACFDTPAFIEKVKEETGLKPVIGGHSTGSIVSEIYLQGAYIDIDEFNAADGKYIPHVKNDPALAAIRNSEIKGFIGIDPAGLTPIATPLLLDNPLTWAVQGLPLRIPFDEIMVTLLGDHRLGAIPVLAIEVVMGAAKALAPVDITGIVDMLYISNPQNINNYVEDFFARYALSSFYMRGASQFVDMALHLTLREHYKNGEENKNRNVPPDPGTAGDDLYSYSENMYLMNVPSFFLLSELDGLVKTELVIESVIEAKEYNVNDEWYEMPGTGHMDVTASLNAPTFFYPKLGAWLEKIK